MLKRRLFLLAVGKKLLLHRLVLNGVMRRREVVGGNWVGRCGRLKWWRDWARRCDGPSYAADRAMWWGELCGGASYVAARRKMERLAECLQNGHPYRGFWQKRDYQR